jgi:hypothetical protein
MLPAKASSSRIWVGSFGIVYRRHHLTGGPMDAPGSRHRRSLCVLRRRVRLRLFTGSENETTFGRLATTVTADPSRRRFDSKSNPRALSGSTLVLLMVLGGTLAAAPASRAELGRTECGVEVPFDMMQTL